MSAPTLATVRERIKDENYVQNLLVEHDGVLNERSELQATIAQLQSRLQATANQNAVQKRQIQALQEEAAQAKAFIDELNKKILAMAAHPDVKAAQLAALKNHLANLQREAELAAAEIAKQAAS